VEPISLDVHAHVVPVRGDAAPTIAGIAWDEADGVLLVDGRAVGMKALYRPDELIGWMDNNRVERAWISVPPPLYRVHLDGEEARIWCVHLNAGLRRVAADFASRLEPLFHLPIQAPQVAVAIAESSTAGGQVRFAVPTGGRPERPLSDPAYLPLWRCLNGVGAFVFFHPGDCADGRLSAYYLTNLLGNPYETAVAIAHLAFGGVVDAFPAITFCFAHGGGAAAMLAGRFQRGFDTGRPGIAGTGNGPRAALRRICVDCIVHDPAAIGLCESVFGPTQVVFGSDWPFPMGLPQPHDALASLTEEQRRRILSANTAPLLRIGAARAPARGEGHVG